MPWRLASILPDEAATGHCAVLQGARFSRREGLPELVNSEMLHPKCGVVLKSCASRSAVSAVTPRLLRTGSFRRTVDMPSVFAARPASFRAASGTPRRQLAGFAMDAGYAPPASTMESERARGWN